MEKGLGNAFGVLATWIIGDVWGLLAKFFMSVLGTVIMPFLFLVGLATPDY